MKHKHKEEKGGSASPNPLASLATAHPAIQAWLDKQIGKSDLELRLGPHCLGWSWGNEAKREEIQVVNDFLHTLAAL